MLANHRIDRYATNHNGSNALHIAVKMNKPDVVQALLDLGYDVERTKYNGVSALGIACLANNLKIFKMLVRAKANIYQLNNKGIGILYLAIKGKANLILKELIYKGLPVLNTKDRNHIMNSAIYFAASSDTYLDAMKVMVEFIGEKELSRQTKSLEIALTSHAATSAVKQAKIG